MWVREEREREKERKRRERKKKNQACFLRSHFQLGSTAAASALVPLHGLNFNPA